MQNAPEPEKLTLRALLARHRKGDTRAVPKIDPETVLADRASAATKALAQAIERHEALAAAQAPRERAVEVAANTLVLEQRAYPRTPDDDGSGIRIARQELERAEELRDLGAAEVEDAAAAVTEARLARARAAGAAYADEPVRDEFIAACKEPVGRMLSAIRSLSAATKEMNEARGKLFAEERVLSAAMLDAGVEAPPPRRLGRELAAMLAEELDRAGLGNALAESLIVNLFCGPQGGPQFDSRMIADRVWKDEFDFAGDWNLRRADRVNKQRAAEAARLERERAEKELAEAREHAKNKFFDNYNGSGTGHTVPASVAR
jgi:hypothetical protein